MATLYEIGLEYQRIMAKIQEQGGEVLPEDEEALDAVEGSKAEKYEAYCKMIMQLKSDAQVFKAEKDRFADKQRSAERTADKLKERLAYSMQSAGEEKYKTQLFTLSFRKSESVEVDETLLPDEYKKVEYSPDKTKIKEALKQGIDVTGATIVTNQSLQIR